MAKGTSPLLLIQDRLPGGAQCQSCRQSTYFLTVRVPGWRQAATLELKRCLTRPTDGRFTLCRVHMPGHHVFSVFILNTRSGAWVDRYCGRCCLSPVYIFDTLVNVMTNSALNNCLFANREFCLRHPEIRDVCDLGQILYHGWRWVCEYLSELYVLRINADSEMCSGYGTAAMFLLNNTFIQVHPGTHSFATSLTILLGSSRSDWC